MAKVRPPRSGFVNFPLGHTCGKPKDIDLQTRIVKDALRILVTSTAPGQILDLPYEWGVPFDWATYRQDVQDMLEEEGAPPQEWKTKE